MAREQKQVRELQEGSYVMMEDAPCKINAYSTAKPGKHGSAKARIEGKGVFDGKKRSLSQPVDAKVWVPIINRKQGQVVSVDGWMSSSWPVAGCTSRGWRPAGGRWRRRSWRSRPARRWRHDGDRAGPERVAEDDPPPGDVVASLLPTAPTMERPPLLDVILQTLQLARERVVLTTPYFVPDDSMLQAMRAAALRGVEVVLVVPKRGDHGLTQAAGRSHYGFLLEAGVRILEYPGALLHAKTLTMDRELAILGSANLDVRSFSLNFELALLVYDTDFASQLHYLQAEYLEKAEPLLIERWQSRGLLRKAGDNLARLVTPLL